MLKCIAFVYWYHDGIMLFYAQNDVSDTFVVGEDSPDLYVSRPPTFSQCMSGTCVCFVPDGWCVCLNSRKPLVSESLSVWPMFPLSVM